MSSGVSGTSTPAFRPLRELLAANLADGTDLGASVAVVHDGELVADLWGGEARPGEPWREDTLVMVWSVTKTMAALTTLLLADRGDLDLDAAGVVVLAGVLERRGPGPPPARAHVRVRRVDRAARRAGAARPRAVRGDAGRAGSRGGRPGRAPATTWSATATCSTGWCARPPAYRWPSSSAGSSPGPLRADFHLGAGEAELARCADLVPPAESGIDFALLPEGNFLVPTITNPLLHESDYNGAAFRSAGLGGVGGLGNARSIARIQSAVSHGGLADGARLLSEETVARIFDVQADGVDQVLFTPMTWGVGYALPNAVSGPAIPDRRVCWWTGWGGSIVVNDLDTRTTVAYAMNRMDAHFTSSARTDAYVRTAFECLS